MTGSMMCKPGRQQTAKNGVKTETHRQSQIQITPAETKAAYPIILALAQSKTQMPDYFHPSDNKEADKRVSETITNRNTK